MEDLYLDFKVSGAGTLHVSKSPHVWTGSAIGFSIGVSWGKHGFAGGVLSRSEALKLAEHIIKTCGECSLTEQEELHKNQIEP